MLIYCGYESTSSVCTKTVTQHRTTNHVSFYFVKYFIYRESGCGLDDRGSRVRFPAGAGNFSLHRVQNGSGAHPASYPMGTGSSFPGVKRPGREADHSPSSSTEVKEWVELYLHSSNTPSWCRAQLQHRENFTFTFITAFVSEVVSSIQTSQLKCCMYSCRACYTPSSSHPWFDHPSLCCYFLPL
jgi:hypothetical protein